MTMGQQYKEDSLLVQPGNFAEAIRKGELDFGYFVDPSSPSPACRVAYKEDKPDKLAISAFIASPEFILKERGY